MQLFFENERRTGGGEIENMERCQPDVAYITFASAEGKNLLTRCCNLTNAIIIELVFKAQSNACSRVRVGIGSRETESACVISGRSKILLLTRKACSF